MNSEKNGAYRFTENKEGTNSANKSATASKGSLRTENEKGSLTHYVLQVMLRVQTNISASSLPQNNFKVHILAHLYELVIVCVCVYLVCVCVPSVCT